jgi:LuxR family maltose regulon positive regulatory protein
VLRGVLRAELDHRQPDVAGELQRRAAQWCEDNGLPDAAVGYAMAAGDADRAARIVTLRVMPLYRSGRIATALRWLDWFDGHGLMDDRPGVATLGALLAALAGHPVRTERWGAVMEHTPLTGMLPDGATPAAGLQAIVSAMLCRHGADRALHDAQTAERVVPPGSAWRPVTMLMVGVSHLMTGDREPADAAFAHAVELASDDGALPAGSYALAQRALIALDRGAHTDAQHLSEHANDLVEQAHLRDHVSCAVVSTAAARIAIADGDTHRANAHLVGAQRLRPKLTYALPFIAAHTRLELVKVLLALADTPGARTVMREVDGLLRLRPDLGTITDNATTLRAQLDRSPIGAIGASSLTTAELRLLPLLQTHLTFRGIGERLYVSPHTVKTQAISIYRKLGVSSRSDAVATATAVGLLT